jgi:hypothetical protein
LKLRLNQEAQLSGVPECRHYVRGGELARSPILIPPAMEHPLFAHPPDQALELPSLPLSTGFTQQLPGYRPLAGRDLRTTLRGRNAFPAELTLAAKTEELTD